MIEYLATLETQLRRECKNFDVGEGLNRKLERKDVNAAWIAAIERRRHEIRRGAGEPGKQLGLLERDDDRAASVIDSGQEGGIN